MIDLEVASPNHPLGFSRGKARFGRAEIEVYNGGAPIGTKITIPANKPLRVGWPQERLA